jgi:predicted signal transduction protein with EAL and GGDEF domain
MTRGRRFAATVAGLLVLAWVGSLLAHALLERRSLQAQLQARNDETAALLAAALSLHDGDAGRLQRLAVVQFERGRFRLLRLTAADGLPVFELQAPQPTAGGPRWLDALLPVAALPGQAEVGHAGRGPGRLELALRADAAQAALWASIRHMAAWLAIGGMLAAAALAATLRSWRRPLHAVAAQPRAVERQQFVIADEPPVPELRQVTSGMHTMARQLQSAAAPADVDVAALHAPSQLDAVTGLWQRQPFLARLGSALRGESHRGAGLLLVRLRRLEAMNRRLGHDGTDRLLAALAQVLQSYPRRVGGALAGRLSGSDFALYLPAAGMSGETARSLAQALRAALATVDPQADLVIGAAELRAGCQVAEALARCDGALARAEGEGGFAVAEADAVPPALPLRGSRDWQAHLSAALKSGRVGLAEYPIRDAQGRLLQLHCPLQIQLCAGGAFVPEPRWRAMAVRCGLSASLDLAAIGLALQASRRDSRPRSVTVAAASLAAQGFIGDVRLRLQAAVADAARLRIDLAEGALHQPRRLQDAAAAWRGAGARIGLVHPGLALPWLPRLGELGVEAVRVDAASWQGLAAQSDLREAARRLVAPLRGMQLQVFAEAVADDADRQALWHLGIDGVLDPVAPVAA